MAALYWSLSYVTIRERWRRKEVRGVCTHVYSIEKKKRNSAARLNPRQGLCFNRKIVILYHEIGDIKAHEQETRLTEFNLKTLALD